MISDVSPLYIILGGPSPQKSPWSNPSASNQVGIHYTKAPEANYLDACAPWHDMMMTHLTFISCE